MSGADEHGESDGSSGTGTPGPLSRLVEALARPPGEDGATTLAEAPAPGERIGRFEVRREIGRGGFGAVYEAYDPELGRAVALKAIRPGRSRAELAASWIRAEAEAVARLHHPNVVTLHEVETAGPYLVMELLEGETLAERLSRGPLPPREALGIAEQIAAGLAHAHARGVLHRDLKPSNVFLCDDGGVKLLDFGLAHLLGQPRSPGAGTPAYMAPEQARGDEVDARADIYSAGVILEEMLTGGRGAATPAVPRPFAALLARARSASRMDRPRDGTAWGEALAAVRRAVERPRAVRRVAGLVAVGAIVGTAAALLASGRGRTAPPALDASIAVLPFADVSPAHDQEYFSDGVAEEILGALSKIDGLRVAGRASSFWFKGKDVAPAEIGRKLGVAHLLEGSVRRAGDRLRVSAEVVRAADGRRIWGETYDREWTDVFAVQDQIARSVAAELRVKLLPAARGGSDAAGPRDPQAYADYLLGRQLFHRDVPELMSRAVEAYERALRRDPGYAQAWAGLSAALEARGDYRDTLAGVLDDRRRALDAANRAVALAPGLADGYVARADLVEVRGWDWDGAMADARRAIVLNPRDADAHVALGQLLANTGRLRDAIPEMERATEVEPLSARAWGWLGRVYALAGRKEEATHIYERVREIEPDSFWVRGPWEMSREEAIATVRRDARGDCRELTHASFTLLRAGAVRESRKGFERLAARCGHTAAWQVAEGFARLGDRDRAFEWMDRALEQLDPGARQLKLFHWPEAFRKDPRFEALLAKVHLPPD